MFYHLLESSHRDDSNKWSNIGFGEEITRVESIETNLRTLCVALFTEAKESTTRTPSLSLGRT